LRLARAALRCTFVCARVAYPDQRTRDAITNDGGGLDMPDSRRACARILKLTGIGLVAAWAGCLPYTVGSTAHTLPIGERSGTANIGITLGGSREFDSTFRVPSAQIITDQEVRLGIADNMDVGLRVTSASGFVLNFKRRHSYDSHPDSAGFATMLGAGFVNMADHALVEGTLIWSGRRRGEFLSYGGLRGMQVIPITAHAVNDTPTLGGFFGLRIGDFDAHIAPEIAVYWDKSALGNRSNELLVVPAVTLKGVRLPAGIFRHRRRTCDRRC
jgi:hypothetical protein